MNWLKIIADEYDRTGYLPDILIGVSKEEEE